MGVKKLDNSFHSQKILQHEPNGAGMLSWLLFKSKQRLCFFTDSRVKSWGEPSRSCSSFTPSSSNGDLQCYKFAQVYNEKREQEKGDFQLALKLQKEFDLLNKDPPEVERRKGTADAYLLRRVSNLEKIM